MNNNQQEDEKDVAAGTKTQTLRISALFKLYQSLGTDYKNKFLDRYCRAAGSPPANPHKSEPGGAPFTLWRQHGGAEQTDAWSE